VESKRVEFGEAKNRVVVARGHEWVIWGDGS
jgi:hypothetical protein